MHSPTCHCPACACGEPRFGTHPGRAGSIPGPGCKPPPCMPHDPCPPPCPPECSPPCKHPCPPQHTQGVLLNKIICSDRKFMPRLCVDLPLESLPCCAKAPYTVLMVQQSGAPPWWTPLENRGMYGRLCFRVCIPVCCQVRDACGCFFSTTAVVEVDAALSPRCDPAECWRHNLVIVPAVRLCCAPVCTQDQMATVQLEVCLEMYLTRLEPAYVKAPTPPCPDLPLYPPPCRVSPPCWPQCPEDRGPCGWPTQG